MIALKPQYRVSSSNQESCAAYLAIWTLHLWCCIIDFIQREDRDSRGYIDSKFGHLLWSLKNARVWKFKAISHACFDAFFEIVKDDDCFCQGHARCMCAALLTNAFTFKGWLTYCSFTWYSWMLSNRICWSRMASCLVLRAFRARPLASEPNMLNLYLQRKLSGLHISRSVKSLALKCPASKNHSALTCILCPSLPATSVKYFRTSLCCISKTPHTWCRPGPQYCRYI